MQNSPHSFSIPVMGTGHSIDSPIRVAPYGINSVISIVDDLLVERIRKHYSNLLELPYKNIPRKAEDGRARRITAYLDLVQEIVQQKFEEIKSQPFFEQNEKAKYFGMLPDGSELKQMYYQLMEMVAGTEQQKLAYQLTNEMQPGSIDVNIMAKVDGFSYTNSGQPMTSEFSDGSAALRGYANSKVSSSLILSAGFNPRLYNYLSEFEDFYRDVKGNIKKKIILKVSDFRSALIQGKYLAKKGLEIFEYRIESGLNCGGHAFASDGYLLPALLKEFKEKREMLSTAIQPLIESFYNENREGGFKSDWEINVPRLTVQGGIGTDGEAKRLLEDFEMDATGWGSPFLMVPEATTVDEPTMKLLQDAKEEDLYLSGVSPLGVPFNNVRNTGSEKWHKERIEKGKPGSPCPKGFLESNTEFTENPICTASTQYQLLKINQINESDIPDEKKKEQREKVLDKACLCDHLGNGALISLGILKEHRAPQAICPGPNIAWFNRKYSLQEMTDHIYGRSNSLVPPERPHMFAKEMIMYVDYFEELIQQSEDLEADLKMLTRFKNNLEAGMDYCMEIAGSDAYQNENLSSISETISRQKPRLQQLFKKLEESCMAGVS
ncbi:MAG: hypothetical protein HUJ22_00535 [Gracilimonas sp.]|uniref:hypothetical protein n=1 Tax=Gracilimonas sp. TaxID=1974203 RepID=UPI0019C6B7FD|nr:hypothetical protein [Gracilimonas sp.]MBD3615026.1 hypothetical protein [Gracilimonas sp.]